MQSKYTPNFIRITNKNCSKIHRKRTKKIKNSHNWWNKSCFAFELNLFLIFWSSYLQNIEVIKHCKLLCRCRFISNYPVFANLFIPVVLTNQLHASFTFSFQLKHPIHTKQRRSTVALYTQSRIHIYAQTQTQAHARHTTECYS